MVRIFHKYLSLAISIQLLLWTISGIFFAFNKIELIRGEQYIVEQNNTKLDLSGVTVSLTAKNLNLIQRLDEWVLKVEENSEVYFLDFSGNKLKSLNSEEAKQVVREKTNLFPVEALRIEKPSTGSEFRGRNLPLFKEVQNLMRM